MPHAEGGAKGKDLRFRPKMANLSECDIVDAFDLAIYCMNAYGEPMCPSDGYEGSIRYFSFDKTFKCGKSGYGDYCVLKGCKSAKKVYVALTRYHIKGGDTVTLGNSNSDPLERYDWLYWTFD